MSGAFCDGCGYGLYNGECECNGKSGIPFNRYNDLVRKYEALAEKYLQNAIARLELTEKYCKLREETSRHR